MKMVMLIVSLAALAFVMYFYINSTMQQSADTPTPEAIIRQTEETGKTAASPPNTVPYEAQRQAAERLSKQLEKAKEAQDAALKKSTGATE